jgi:hypothetical protein
MRADHGLSPDQSAALDTVFFIVAFGRDRRRRCELVLHKNWFQAERRREGFLTDGSRRGRLVEVRFPRCEHRLVLRGW